MDSPLYRYRFADKVDLADGEDSLLLAALATEGIFGESRVRIDFRYALDRSIRAIIVDASTPVGQMVNSIFTAFILREFGRDAFDIRRVEGLPGRTCQEGGR
jgi:hypothetical protein